VVVATIGGPTQADKSKTWCDSLDIMGDGRTALCGADMAKNLPAGAALDAQTEPAPVASCAPLTDAAYPGFVEISLTSDKLVRVLYIAQPPCMGAISATILWSSPSGNTVLGTVGYPDDPPTQEHYEVVLVRHGKATILNWPGAATMLSANRVAFLVGHTASRRSRAQGKLRDMRCVSDTWIH